MYLTRMFLDHTSRNVRFDAANPDGLHKTVMRLFPDHVGIEPRKTLGILHRLDESADGRLVLHVQSRSRPEFAKLLQGYLLDLRRDPDLLHSGVDENPAVRDVSTERGAIRPGDRFLFRLKANTTRKIGTKSAPDGQRVNGRRVPVRGEGERIDWLSRHAASGGFEVSGVRVRELAAQGRSARFAGALFDGLLEVKEPAQFCAQVEAGVGPAKAFGFGLLSLRRAAGL